MKNILLFGAGKSATVLIRYLLKEADTNNWYITIADANKSLIEEKTGNHPNASAEELNITEDHKRSALIEQADIVISMMPPALHMLIARDCITCGKHLLTASYADDAIKSLETAAKNKGILFLCEMGLDPGIDHMSAMQLLDEIKEKGGEVISFKSHCGGLVAPESDDNPWRYKISWNPKNIVLAGKAGALYRENNRTVEEPYEKLFNPSRTVSLQHTTNQTFSYYPNRNSLPYMALYGLDHASTFIRTTLRYPEFMHAWKEVIDLKLTDETPAYQTDDLSLKDFFEMHFDEYQIKKSEHLNPPLLFLGLEDTKTIINKGMCSAAEVLQFCLEKKLALKPGDKDLIVMLHEIEFLSEGKHHRIDSSLLVKGDDHINTAMAKTVGLPLGIAAKLILNGTIKLSGLHIPVIKEIYNPVLEELKNYGIEFQEYRQ